MASNHLKTLSDYNLWANDKICSYILEAGQTLADKETESSFPTIRKTLYHLWDAQAIWLKRLNGESSNSWPSHNFTGNLEEAIKLINENSQAFVDYTAALKDKEHLVQIEFKATDGTPYYNTVEEILMHVMNHSTFHRGQLITMLRSVGFTSVGSTDMIRFFRL
jgi:uncharacterized damage-inducible protein DinB